MVSIAREKYENYIGKIWKRSNNIDRSYDTFIRNIHDKWLIKVFVRLHLEISINKTRFAKLICSNNFASVARGKYENYIGKIWKRLDNIDRSYDTFTRNIHDKWLIKVFERLHLEISINKTRWAKLIR